MCVFFLSSGQREVTSKTSGVEGAVKGKPSNHLTDAQPTTLSTGSTWVPVLSIFTDCGLGPQVFFSCEGRVFTLPGVIVKRLKVGSFQSTVWHLGPGGSAPLAHSNEERDDGGGEFV